MRKSHYDGILFVWGEVKLDKWPDFADNFRALYKNEALDPF
jgi:hypothetical protein